MAAEKQQLVLIMLEHGIEWEQKGTHGKHLSLLDFEKQEREKEMAALEEQKAELEEHNATMIKEMERFAEKYSADPDEVLPEAGTLETGKSYQEKKVKPLIKKIVTVLRSVYRAYLDLSRRFSDMQKSYERVWDKINSLTVHVEELWNVNRVLKERIGDFNQVERALGRSTVETIILREKRLEEDKECRGESKKERWTGTPDNEKVIK